MSLLFLFITALGLSLAMAGAWAVQRRTGASGWIDTIWSFAVGAGGIGAVLAADGAAPRRIAAFVLIAAWSIRLGSHIFTRTKAGGEDPRYAKLIEDWGKAASSRLFLFLQIQAIAGLILVLAIYLAASNPSPVPHSLDLIGIVVALSALAGEAISDRQLSQFRKTPEAKTEICEEGFWRYSRHPNYFFEWLYWCAWPLLALTAPSSISWAALLAPAMMYWLLVYASGIPPLEDHMLRSRGDKFRALQRRVNAFFPGPRKEEA